MRNRIFVLFLLSIIVLLNACSPYKHITDNGYLLNRNIINLDNKTLKKEDFQNLIKQDPNGDFLFVKWSMYFYSLSPKGEDSNMNFINRNIFRNLGSKPVEYSEALGYRSANEMKKYLIVKGCFDSKVEDSLVFTRKWYNKKKINPKKVNKIYNIYIGNRYLIDTFTYTYQDTILGQDLRKIMHNSPLKKGIYYDEELFTLERDRIERGLREEGYYDFVKENIIFKIDTNKSLSTAKVDISINNPKSKDSSIEIFNKYKIRRIYVMPYQERSSIEGKVFTYDTNIFYHRPRENYGLNQYYYISQNPSQINPKPILRSILFQYDSLYSPLQAEKTYSALSNLKNFKFIDISYSKVSDSTKLSDTLMLDAFIRLSLDKPILFSTSLEANFSASTNSVTDNNPSNFGLQYGVGLQHKNLFKNAEIFSSNLKFAIELRSDIFNKSDSLNTWNFVNAFETGIDFGIEFPRFLIPFGTRFYSMQFLPHTSLRGGYNFQKRPYFERSIFNLNYGYSWNNQNKYFHWIMPVEINLVKMNITNSDYADLIKTFDKRIQYQTSDHLVMNTRYSYVYNGQELNKKKDFRYLRLNAEIAGNALYLISSAFSAPKNSNKEYIVFTIPFSQYIRTDFDYKKYSYLNSDNVFVFRAFGGVGIPYGNASALPYEKSFFAGGANSLRAWQLRELGPGSSQKDNSILRFDRSGDISLGANFEYRFPIAGIFEGASFVDIGNVWTIKEQIGLEGGQFQADRFFKEIAAGIGLGIRVNIQFLIVRLDFAAKIWDPSKDIEERLVIDNTKLKDINVNLGIGYPF